MSTIVDLTWAELACAANVGVLRQAISLKDGMEHKYGYNPDVEGEWWTHELAAQAEMAVAKALGRYWPASINARKAEPDIPPNVQVRVRRVRHAQLVVRPNDIDDHYYVSVFPHDRVRGVFVQRFELFGVIKGAEAKSVGALEDRQGRKSPAYFVRDDQLTPFPVRQ